MAGNVFGAGAVSSFAAPCVDDNLRRMNRPLSGWALDKLDPLSDGLRRTRIALEDQW